MWCRHGIHALVLWVMGIFKRRGNLFLEFGISFNVACMQILAPWVCCWSQHLFIHWQLIFKRKVAQSVGGERAITFRLWRHNKPPLLLWRHCYLLMGWNGYPLTSDLDRNRLWQRIKNTRSSLFSVSSESHRLVFLSLNITPEIVVVKRNQLFHTVCMCFSGVIPLHHHIVIFRTTPESKIRIADTNKECDTKITVLLLPLFLALDPLAFKVSWKLSLLSQYEATSRRWDSSRLQPLPTCWSVTITHYCHRLAPQVPCHTCMQTLLRIFLPTSLAGLSILLDDTHRCILSL